MPTPCYLFDIDGTLADLTHRLHHIQKQPKDWDAFFEGCADDAPIPHIIDLAKDLSKLRHVVFVSGRSDRVREQTERWLSKHGLSGELYMRKDGDHRPDNLVKGELLDAIIGDAYAPIMAFDDRNQVVEMWRARACRVHKSQMGIFDMSKIAKMLKLGATGAFPEGKLNKTDEGELRMAVSSTGDGLVRVDFGKPVAWFAISPNQAKELAAHLMTHASRGISS